MNIYYVYGYIRKYSSANGIAGSPYYIGKGKKRRAYSTHKGIKVPKDRSQIKFYALNLTENEAFNLESSLIHTYGKLCDKTGCLYNLTNGGDGSSGLYKTEKTKKKISASLKGKPRPDYVKRKISQAKQGKPNIGGKFMRSDATKRLMSINNSGRKWIHDNNREIKVTYELIDDHLKNGFFLGRLP